jgi:general stress protein 26
MKDEALTFLADKMHCVISTVDPTGKPEAAFVAFSENEDLEIMIGTSTKSRKFLNIRHNPAVSIVFGFDGKRSMQYEGTVHALEGKELTERLKRHFVKHPWAAKLQENPDHAFIAIEPSWIRIVEAPPTVIGEMRFDQDEN